MHDELAGELARLRSAQAEAANNESEIERSYIHLNQLEKSSFWKIFLVI